MPKTTRLSGRRPGLRDGSGRAARFGLRPVGPPSRIRGTGGSSSLARRAATIFLIHLGLTLAAFVFRAGILFFPGIVAGPYADGAAQLLLALPGIFVFDLGLAVISRWASRREDEAAPPDGAGGRPPARKAAVGAAWRIVLLIALHAGDRYLCRLWVFARQHAYTLLGPGFYRGLPLLDMALAAGIAAELILCLARPPVLGRTVAFAARFVSLIGVGLFFALPKLLILPSFLGAPPGAGDTAAKLIALPAIAVLTWRAVRQVPAFLAAISSSWETPEDRKEPPRQPPS
ncbi:MAG: hypothetical protein ACM3XS_09955 [Bacteroidota bacterium]